MVKNGPYSKVSIEDLQVLCAFKIHVTDIFFSHKIRPLSEITYSTIPRIPTILTNGLRARVKFWVWIPESHLLFWTSRLLLQLWQSWSDLFCRDTAHMLLPHDLHDRFFSLHLGSCSGERCKEIKKKCHKAVCPHLHMYMMMGPLAWYNVLYTQNKISRNGPQQKGKKLKTNQLRPWAPWLQTHNWLLMMHWRMTYSSRHHQKVCNKLIIDREAGR